MSIYSPSFISFNILVNTLCPWPLFTCCTFLCFVVKVVNKLRLWYEGAPKYLGESVTGMKFGLRKRWRSSDASIVTGDSSIDASRCTDELQCFLCACTVVSHQKIKADDCDVMKWDHNDLSCYFGGNYKRRAHTNLRAVIWVFWHWTVGSIDKSQTLYLGYLCASHRAVHNQNELCVSFIHMHVLRPFGELFSQYDFSYLTLAG